MPTFIYKAKKDAANTVNGQINAANAEEAVDMIHQLGLVPVSVLPIGEEGDLISDIKPAVVKAKAVAVFSRQLSGLLKSGVPLLKSLEVIAAQTKERYLASVINEMAIGVKSGRPFSQCLAEYPHVFEPLYIAMIRAGEEIGQLKHMLLNMAEYLHKQEEFSTKVRHAAVYPAVMLMVGISTVIFILTFVMPKVTVIFLNASQQLPWPTQVVMTLSHALKYTGLPLLFLMAIAAIVFNRWRRTATGRMVLVQVMIKVPLLKDFILKADLARFTRTLQLLLESGLPIIRAIETAVPTIRHPLLRSQLLIAAQQINGGESLGNALATVTLFEPLMVGQIAVAEESGNLSEALGDLAQMYENDVDVTTKSMTVLMEPVMIVVVGAIVGFMVFAMLMPIFSMDIMAR